MKPMTINQIISLFAEASLSPEASSEKHKRLYFDEVLHNFCSLLNIRNWEQFKKSDRIKTFHSPKLRRNIVISGDRRTKRPEGCWTASEIEHMFELELSTEELDKVDKIKTLFNGSLVKVSEKEKKRIEDSRRFYMMKP